MKRRLTKLLALMLVTTTCFSTIDISAFAAENNATDEIIASNVVTVSGNDSVSGNDINTSEEIQTESIFESNGMKYTFKLLGTWDSGYNASIRIDNFSDKIVEDWKIETDYVGDISNIWNAVVVSKEDGKTIIQNAEWNQDIDVNSYVEFGISGAEPFVEFPTTYRLLNGIKENNAEDYSVEYQVLNDWISGFTGNVTITNNTEKTIEDWVLEFDGDNEISVIWNGVIESHEGSHYVIKNAGYNQNICAGNSISFGFNVNAGNAMNGFTNFTLKSYAEYIQDLEEDEPIPEPGEFDSIGEAYYKQPKEEDIIYDEESGFFYVKNQLLISAYMGLEKSVIEDIAEEIGAEIVGYIALTNDYQLEFREDKSIDDLVMIAEYIDSFSFVSCVTLNLGTFMEEEATTNDTLYNSLTYDTWDETAPGGYNWGLETLKVLSAWDSEADFVPVKVGVYDHGFAPSHEDLRYAGLENNHSTEITTDAQGNKDNHYAHGTHVAGILAALHNNNKGISGVATDTQLYCYGSGSTGVGSSMGDKMAYAKLVGNHVKVINVSLGLSYELQVAANNNIVIGGTDYSQKAKDYVTEQADILEEYLSKLVTAGYDFVICTSAGNTNNSYYVKDASKTKNYGLRTATSAEKNDISIVKYGGNIDAFYDCALTAIDNAMIKNRIIVVGNITQNKSLNASSNIGSRVDVVAPGTDIMSTVPFGADASGYMKKTGTSMASPHIAGVVALMYQANPDLRATVVKAFLTSSASQYVSNYPVPDAAKCVAFAKSFSTTINNDISWPSGMISGETVDSNGNSLGLVSFTAVRKNTGDYNVGTVDDGRLETADYSFTFISDSTGKFLATLPQGNYDILVKKTDYLPYCIKNVTINPDETNYIGEVKLTKWSGMNTNASVVGTIKNAITGVSEPGVMVKLRKGWNTTGGAYAKDPFGRVRTATTDATGKFTISAAVGSYTAEISKNGFVTGYYNVISTISSYVPVFVISPILSSDEYRIVLTWGSSPRDLDSHLSYYVGDTRMAHVYYSNKVVSYNGDVLAKLDLDDTSSYGPETVTITLNADLLKDNNIFKYSVHDFTNRSSAASTAMSLSDAVIHVYAGNTLLKTYFIPKNEVGTVWHVFDITENGLVTYNEFYNEASPSEVK